MTRKHDGSLTGDDGPDNAAAQAGGLNRILGSIVDLALAKRAVAVLAAALIVAGGVWTAGQFKTELLPNLEIPVVTILTIYPAADPDSVLNDVTIQAENAVAGLPGLKTLDSTSEAGVSIVVAQFQYGTDLKQSIDTINRNLAAVKLPSGAMQPKVSEIDLGSQPIMRLSLTGDKDPTSLADIAEKQIVPELSTIDGVSAVQVSGSAKKRIVVSLNADQLNKNKVSLSQVVTSLQANNIAAPSGDIPQNGRDLTVRVGNQLSSLQDIENLIVLPSLGAVGGSGSPGVGQPSAIPQSFHVPGQGSQPPAQDRDDPVYVVKPGDTLSSIAQRFYGDASAYQKIVQANSGQLTNPHMIMPGMTLVIPAAGSSDSASPTPPTQGTRPQSGSTTTPGQVPGTPPGASSGLTQMPQVPQIPTVHIHDLGNVALSAEENSSVTRTNGQPSVGVLVFKARDANTVRVAGAVNSKLRDLKDALGDTDVVTIQDESKYIQESIRDLEREGALGGFFAIVVIFLFLFNARSTMVTAVSMPISILVAFLLMGWRDISLNIMTMGALTISLGRVVDDAIVVMENIYRHVQRGESPMQAAHAGTKEVAAAITISTLTTVAVFLPLAFVGGIVGQVFQPFALTVTFALLASLFVALTIIPVLATFLIRPTAHGKGRVAWLHAVYTPGVTWALKHRRATLGVAGVLFVGSFALLPYIGTAFLPSASEKQLQVTVEMPAGTSMSTTSSVAQQVEDKVKGLADLEVFQTTIGNTGSLLGMTGIGAGNASTADIFMRLRPSTDLNRVVDDLRTAFGSIDGPASIVVSPLENAGGGSNKLEITVLGDDYQQVSETAKRAVASLGSVEGLSNVESDVTAAKPEVSVKVDPEKAIQHGMTAAQVAMKVREMMVGQQATKITLDGKSTDVYVQVDPEDTNSLDKLKSLTVGTVNPVPLSEIADVQSVDGPVRIARSDQARAATITGDITTSDTGAVNSAVRQNMVDLEKPSGVRTQVGGVAEQMMEGFSNLGISLLVAVVLVYLVMVATMGSLSQPLVILASLPLASIGALLALFLTHRPLGMSSMIGLLMLVGIVVTNAVVLLDLVGQLRRRGFSVPDALKEGGRTRVRPILMTAMATILALTPLVLGFGQGTIIAAELATVVVGGLLTSTLLTLLVVPVVYSLVDQVTARLGGDGS